MPKDEMWDAPDIVPAITYADLPRAIEWLGRVTRGVALAIALLVLLFVEAAPVSAQQQDSASAAVAAAQTAAATWLRIVDSLKHGESWDSAAAPLKDAMSKADWEEAVTRVRGPLEPFGTRKLLSAMFTTTLPNAPPGNYVVLRYQTPVAGNRTVTETVTPMQESDGTWRVAGYYVRQR